MTGLAVIEAAKDAFIHGSCGFDAVDDNSMNPFAGKQKGGKGKGGSGPGGGGPGGGGKGKKGGGGNAADNSGGIMGGFQFQRPQ